MRSGRGRPGAAASAQQLPAKRARGLAGAGGRRRGVRVGSPRWPRPPPWLPAAAPVALRPRPSPPPGPAAGVCSSLLHWRPLPRRCLGGGGPWSGLISLAVVERLPGLQSLTVLPRPSTLPCVDHLPHTNVVEGLACLTPPSSLRQEGPSESHSD